jgi:hypothetical protein
MESSIIVDLLMKMEKKNVKIKQKKKKIKR